MRVTSNLDESILGEMDQIMGSDEHKNTFAPMMRKEAAANQAELDSQNAAAKSSNQVNYNTTTDQNPTSQNVSQITAKLTSLLSEATDQNTKAAAQSVLSGHAAPGAGQALLRHFPGQTAQSLEALFQQVKHSTASVSTVIPVIVKIANTLSAMGYELSELVADKLIQTITIEAKAKVEAKKVKPGKCELCGKKCDEKGKCTKEGCKGKCKKEPKEKGKCDTAKSPAKKTY